MEDFVFASCDIVGHSAEPDASTQVQRATAMNEVVRAALQQDAAHALWFSGGDGGHLAMSGPTATRRAIELLLALRRWATESQVALRLVGCTGQGQRFSGADGRVDMAGPGLNMAARLLQHVGSKERIVVTSEFRDRCVSVVDSTARFHDPRTIRGPFTVPQQVLLFSIDRQFVSVWDSAFSSGPAADRDDRTELNRAVAHKDGLAVLYHAKRLLQVNSSNADAIKALREFVGSEASRLGPSRILTQLFSDISLAQEIVRAAVLVEREPGETLFRAGDDGQTMFLVLRGRLAGYLPKPGEPIAVTPDFEIGPGELVGEMAFALKSPRNAALLCVEDCSLLAFSQQELFTAAPGPRLAQVKQSVDAIVRGRILQNTVRAASFLGGPNREGPLGAYEKPWVDLDAFSRTIAVPWKDRDLRTDGPEFRAAGLYLLVAGKLQLPDGTALTSGHGEPSIMAAEWEREVNYRPGPLRVLADVTVLFVSSEGIDQFGPDVHARVMGEILSRTSTPESRHQPVEMSAVEGLLRIGGRSSSPGGADVVFVHGLDGDSRTTWEIKDEPSSFWPAWLAEDVQNVTVWSLGYEVNSSAWRGTSMPLSDRATNVLATLETAGLGRRPIVFICHSLGGLLVKQLLRHALDFGNAPWRAIAEQTKGIVFLSTPHSGSDISSWMKHLGTLLRLTVSVDELQAHDPALRQLNMWFRNSSVVRGMSVQAYCEKKRLGGALVVNETSADPGLPGVVPIPLDDDHVTICKPTSRDRLLYSRVKQLVTAISAAN